MFFLTLRTLTCNFSLSCLIKFVHTVSIIKERWLTDSIALTLYFSSLYFVWYFNSSDCAWIERLLMVAGGCWEWPGGWWVMKGCSRGADIGEECSAGLLDYYGLLLRCRLPFTPNPRRLFLWLTWFRDILLQVTLPSQPKQGNVKAVLAETETALWSRYVRSFNPCRIDFNLHQEIQVTLNRFQQDLSGLASKISELEGEAEEHEFVFCPSQEYCINNQISVSSYPRSTMLYLRIRIGNASGL